MPRRRDRFGGVLPGRLRPRRDAPAPGEVDAFAAFYDVTAPLIVALLEGVLGTSGRAEEVAEAVYLAVWREAPVFDPLTRSADSTLLRAVRRALIGTVGRMTSGGSAG